MAICPWPGLSLVRFPNLARAQPSQVPKPGQAKPSLLLDKQATSPLAKQPVALIVCNRKPQQPPTYTFVSKSCNIFCLCWNISFSPDPKSTICGQKIKQIVCAPFRGLCVNGILKERASGNFNHLLSMKPWVGFDLIGFA